MLKTGNLVTRILFQHCSHQEMEDIGFVPEEYDVDWEYARSGKNMKWLDQSQLMLRNGD